MKIRLFLVLTTQRYIVVAARNIKEVSRRIFVFVDNRLKMFHSQLNCVFAYSQCGGRNFKPNYILTIYLHVLLDSVCAWSKFDQEKKERVINVGNLSARIVHTYQ